jgi:signal transduction histidine kinase
VATEGALLRIAQEALANAYRHSGAGRVGVHLVLAPRRVELRVRDDGRGFDPDQVAEGVGLASMRERAAALPGGTLAVESAHGAGTTISVRCDRGGSAQ